MNNLILAKKKKSAILIFTYMVLTSLLIISASYSNRLISELNSSRRFLDREKALWAAEAGRTVAYCHLKDDANWDYTSLSSSDKQVSSDSSFDISVNTVGAKNIVTVTGSSGDAARRTSFSISYIPSLHNALSTGNKLLGTGIIFALDINGNAEAGNRVWKKSLWGGYIEDTSWITTHSGNDYDWSATPSPQITYPDGETDANTTEDEFSDFKDYSVSTINDYNPSEVVYIQTNDNVVVYPGWNGEGKILVDGQVLKDNNNQTVTLTGKKIVYVEGDNAGDGDVDIVFGGSEVFNDGEDMTIISTGDVTYLEPLQSGQSTSRLNVITYEDYDEASILWTNHNLNVYAHNNVNFLSLLSSSSTEGTYTANNDTELIAILAAKHINFPDNTTVPPGFEGFYGLSQGNIFEANSHGTLNQDWQEL